MKRALACALVILAGCGKEPASRPEPTAVRPVDAAPARFVSATGGFSISGSFGAPQEKQVDDPNGGRWTSTQWSPTKRSLYGVQYADYASHAAAVAETMGFIPTRDTASIQRDAKIERDGRPGRELSWAANPQTTIHARFLIDDKRVYKIIVGNQDPAAAWAFIDSFALSAPASTR